MASSNVDVNYLRQVFDKIDTDRSAHLDAGELQKALSNGTWNPFNPETVRLLMLMFDNDRSGNVDFNEFMSMWVYVDKWQSAFHRLDTNRSGSIGRQELVSSLRSSGYAFTDVFITFLLIHFDRQGRGKLLFDDFLQVHLVLHSLTEAFKPYDNQRRGVITITYEQFLTQVLSSRI